MIGRAFRPMASGVTNPAQWLIDAIGMSDSQAGIQITPSTSLNYSAFYACVVVISESLASLPFIIYRRLQNGGKERAPEEPVYQLLHNRPNELMTPFSFFQTGQANILTWGNAYAEIVDSRMASQSLMIQHPEYVRPRLIENGQLEYEIRVPGVESRIVPSERMLHVPGLGDGIVGWSPLRMHREAVGLGLAAEKFGAKWFGHGSRPSGILVHPNRMQKEHREAFRAEWEKNMGGENQNKVAILEEGFTRKFQVSEMARIHRIPPHMIGDLEHATFSNIEQQAIEFVTYCLRPWLIRWEQEINRKLLGNDPDVFGEFLVDALLRGDLPTRMAAYATGLQNAIYSPNEVRNFENLNPYDGGDDYLSPLNMTPAPRNDGGNAALLFEAERTLSQAEERLQRKEQRAIRTAATKHLRGGDVAGFNEWIESFYATFAVEAVGVLESPVQLCNMLRGGGESAYNQVRLRCEHARVELTTRTYGDNPEKAVVGRLDEWGQRPWLQNTETS